MVIFSACTYVDASTPVDLHPSERPTVADTRLCPLAPIPLCNVTQVQYDVNVTGTQNLLEAARAAGVKKFVFTSSAR